MYVCGVVVVAVAAVVLEATFTHVSVHTWKNLQAWARLAGGLTPGSSTPGVSATPRALEHSHL